MRMAWPTAEELDTPRLHLEPLTVEHAAEMIGVLADPSLYRFIGGKPPALAHLRELYERMQTQQSADGTQWWLNWIARLHTSGDAIGTVQATVERHDSDLVAEIAWIVAAAHQGRGFATEATAAMLDWLRRAGVVTFVAHIHPDHDGSIKVARRMGLHPTDQVEDGEIRWSS
jgi:RimJ/RimL family protein N-acetyltransferase